MGTTTMPFQPRSDALAWRVVDGEAVAISLDDRRIHNFNETGTFIWSRLASGRAPAEIARDLAAEFAVDEVEALSDVEVFLTELELVGLVRRTQEG
jgi:hypothetical protein